MIKKSQLNVPLALVLLATVGVGYLVLAPSKSPLLIPSAPNIGSAQDLEKAEKTLDSIDPGADLETAQEIETEMSVF